VNKILIAVVLRRKQNEVISGTFQVIRIRKVMLSLYRPWRPLELREVAAPTFSVFGSQMAARLSALRAGRFLIPGRFLVLISVRS
jgi:hypothetical protein